MLGYQQDLCLTPPPRGELGRPEGEGWIASNSVQPLRRLLTAGCVRHTGEIASC